ncbi:hypothetical protein, partial [Ochrobactrum sp. SFR4]|uniref:hypothetical protein n=1 Tax=Ochrobactrum sp. SFR4 TaxID=2717368 RepID=UPI001C8BFE24
IADDPLAREAEMSLERPSRGGGRTSPSPSLFKKPSLDNMGPGTDMAKPLGPQSEDDPAPIRRHRAGAGSYEDPVDVK